MLGKQVYKKRRTKLSKNVKEGLILILGNKESPMNCSANHYSFRQDSSFRYLFGINKPNFAGVIDIDNDKEYLFGYDFDIDDIIWMGQQPSVKELAERAGVKISCSFNKLSNFIAENINRPIHFMPPYRTDNNLVISDLLKIKYDSVKEKASVELIKAMIKLRSKKDVHEINAIHHACNIGYEMHTTAMKMCHEGVSEREIAGTLEGIALAKGHGVSYPIILSQNGHILHNHSHDDNLSAGRLLLVDAGAETISGYASDFTRTIPVNGNFTQQQKEIYSIVLDANEMVNASAKPGITYKSLHIEACKVIAKGMIDLGIMKGDAEEAVKLGAHALFMPHGLGHMMGMDVHDMEDYGENYVGYDDKTSRSSQFGLAYLRLGRELEEGFVFTNEPGIYFIPDLIAQWKAENKFTNFIDYDKLDAYSNFGGIRLEDNLLITKSGAEFLGDKRIPIEINDVVNFVKNNN